MNWRVFNDPTGIQIPVNMARVTHLAYPRSPNDQTRSSGRAWLYFGKDHYLEVVIDDLFTHHITDALVQVVTKN